MADARSGPRLFFSVGDTSGDQHAARLLRRLGELLPGLASEGVGGRELAAAGMPLHADLVSRAIIGVRPALAVVPEFLGLLRRIAGVFDTRRPDAVVLVDYPGFNLFVARLAHKRGIPVVYFVAPQLWAWAPWRVRRFARVVDEALVIFPFEEHFYRDAGIDAHYIGHPLIDALPETIVGRASIESRPRPVALLPGSRPREVRQHMPLLLAAAQRLAARHPDASFHTAHVSPEERDKLAAMATAAGVPLEIHGDDVHGVMAGCRCALVASGTATLETAMLGTPLVVFYRITPTEDRLRHWLLIPPWVGQVNLVGEHPIVPEVLLAHDDPAALVDAALPLMSDTDAWRAQLAALQRLREQAAGPGAVERAAQRLAARLGG